jgi:hypothetical protein
MNPLACCKATLKDMKPLLEAHPDNKNLKKCVNRLTATLEEVKKGGYTKGFEKAWKAYGMIGSKPESQEMWTAKVLDEELVLACIPRYLKECKDNDTPVQHFQRWLKGERYERYEQIKAKVAKKRMCQICKVNPSASQLSIQQYIEMYKSHRPVTVNVCTECTKYKDWAVVDIKADLDNVIIGSSETIKPVTQAERPLAGGTDDTNQAGGSLSPVNTKQRIDNAMNKYGMKFKEK